MIGALLVRHGVKRAFEALNRRDLPFFMDAIAEDAVLTFPGDVAASGVHGGRERIEGWLNHFLEQFPTLRFDVEHIALHRPYTLGWTNTALVEWEVTLVNAAGQPAENRGVTAIGIRNGKVVRIHEYLFKTGDAFRTAWGEAPTPRAGRAPDRPGWRGTRAPLTR